MVEALDQDGSKRRRAFKPKTRTGCITCRIRRIKCDEGKPSCKKCTSTGRKCDGYVTPGNDKSPRHRDRSPSVKNVVPKPSLPHLTIIPFTGTKLEYRAFQYFQQETIPQICGFYRSQFWFQSVLQACHHNTAIRHAAIALGSLHEQYGSVEPTATSHSDDLTAGGFALEQYNKAIHALLELGQTPTNGVTKCRQNVDVALITCILFACFEALRGHLGSVFDHIDGGVKILSDLQAYGLDPATENSKLRQATTSFAPISELNILFTRLDIQGSAMLGSHRLKLVPQSILSHPTTCFELPSKFSSFEEARDAQDAIFRWLHHDFRGTLTNRVSFSKLPCPNNIRHLKTKYTQKLEEWSIVYESFLGKNEEKRGRMPDHMLRLLHIFIFMHADVDHEAVMKDETTWDLYTCLFEKIISHAKAIIFSTSYSAQKKAAFSLDTLIIIPLYFVASRCRHPKIRREAIKCLWAANRQEGLWESRTIARTAQRVMDIEEEGIEGLVDGTEIPAWKRISDVQPELDSDGRRAIIHFKRLAVGGENSLMTEVMEVLEW